MNKNLNLVEILKNCPIGTKFYSSYLGKNVIFIEIYDNHIKCEYSSQIDSLNCSIQFRKDGSLYPGGDCMLFPSKEQRDWSKWQNPFVDGDILATDEKKTYHNTRFGFERLLDFEKELPKINKILNMCGYEWDAEKKELKTLQPFKDGDILLNKPDSECMLLLSKNQYDWSIWLKPFVDGDVVIFGDDRFAIFKEYIQFGEIANLIRYYLQYDAKNDDLNIDEGECWMQRLATEEEKEKFFDAIKSHGYKWNAETKTLENLIKSKEDTEDKTVMSGIYFDREYYADEVELHLNNYEIEIRDGKTYAIFKNQETKISKSKFKEGDIVISAFGDIHLLRTEDSSYCAYRHKRKNKLDNIITTNITVVRLATEEEKEKLFKVIKDNGYEWDVETKTLKKLIVPKFKSGDMIVKKDDPTKYWSVQGIDTYYNDHYCIITKGMFDNLYFKDQDDWELLETTPKFKVGDRIKHKCENFRGERTITSYDKRGYWTSINDWIDYEDQDDWELLETTSKFKVGDKIRHKTDRDYIFEISRVYNDSYGLVGSSLMIPMNYQNEYELVSNKFDISTLKPFDWVLVRDDNTSVWINAFFGFYDTEITKKHPFVANGVNWAQCIPYEGNENLLGKYDDCDEYYKNWV